MWEFRTIPEPIPGWAASPGPGGQVPHLALGGVHHTIPDGLIPNEKNHDSYRICHNTNAKDN